MSTRPKIVLPWSEMFHVDGRALLEQHGHVVALSRRMTDGEWKQALADADAVLIVGNTEYIDEDVLQAAPRLKIVSRFGVGYDTIDVAACTRHGVVATTSTGNVSAVADLAFGLILSIARRIPQAHLFTQHGEWQTVGSGAMSHFMGEDVSGATLGVIGFGRIGQEVAKRGTGFDMRILYHDVAPNPSANAPIGATFVSLELLLAEADFVSLSCPLNDRTRHLINRETLRQMKPTAFLVSTARGPVVDNDALLNALREGWIAGAALDVVEGEPIGAGHPLLALDNVVVTPHIGAAARGANRRLAIMAAEEVVRALDGKPVKNPLNPELRVPRAHGAA